MSVRTIASVVTGILLVAAFAVDATETQDAVTALFSVPTSLAEQSARNQVVLPWGSVHGNLGPAGREFLGIPYAHPPRRFAAPEPWNQSYAGGQLDASSFSPICVQIPGSLLALQALDPPASSRMSEDCLYLNIYTPSSIPPTGLPVMIWIHGGALQTGTAMMSFYNGSVLAQTQEVIVVAMNYRLNALGFMPVTLEDGQVSANNGFRDQQEALRWVRQNIGSFGGDSSRTTLFGESAGGQSIGMHLVSEASVGLFSAAISESGVITDTRPLGEALNASAVIAQHLACSGLRCLRAANASSLASAWVGTLVPADSDGYPDSAVIDGQILPGEPVSLIKAGKFQRVPLLIGTNANEGALFLYPIAQIFSQTPTGPVLTAKQARCILSLSAGEQSRGVEALYPVLEAQNNMGPMVDLFSDLFNHCGNRRIALAMAQAGNPVYMFSFRRSPSCPIVNVPGAAHAAEIPYVFGNNQIMADATNCTVPPEDLQLSRDVGNIWGSFARDHKAPPGWPRFDQDSENVVKLDIGMNQEKFNVDAGYRQPQCDALQKLGIGQKTWHLMEKGVFVCMMPTPPTSN